MSNLLVENKDIKVSKSPFIIFKNEKSKFESTSCSINKFIFNKKNGAFGGIELQILLANYKLTYATARQLTQYLDLVQHINVNQSSISNKLIKLYGNNVVSRYSFVSDERIKDTNMKAYCIEKNGMSLLQSNLLIDYRKSRTYDESDISQIKNILVRNQYILKVLENTNVTINDILLTPSIRGVRAIYSTNNVYHIVIPIRKNLINQEEIIVNIMNDIKTDSSIANMVNRKYIFIAENDTHMIEIYIVLLKYKLLSENVLFTQDLRLLDRNIDKCFVNIGYEKGENKKISWKIDEISIEDFNLNI